MQIVAIAIPFFFLCIGLELAIARARRVEVYRFNDALTDLGCGIAQQVSLVFLGAFLLTVYARLYAHAPLALPVWAQWTIAVVVVDFLYYWWHRFSHEVNFRWRPRRCSR